MRTYTEEDVLCLMEETARRVRTSTVSANRELFMKVLKQSEIC